MRIGFLPQAPGRWFNALIVLAVAAAPAYYLDTRTKCAPRGHTLVGGGEGPSGDRADWTFGPNVPVSGGMRRTGGPTSALPDGKLYATWMDDRTGTYQVYGSHSIDGGQSWSADQRLDDAPAGSMARFVSVAALGPDRIGAVWKDARGRLELSGTSISRTGSECAGRSASVRINTMGGSTDAGS